MAYVVGLLTLEEKAELERRGWDVEPGPVELFKESEEEVYAPWKEDPNFFCRVGPNDDTMFLWAQVWVDSSMFEVMDGPDWEKG